MQNNQRTPSPSSTDNNEHVEGKDVREEREDGGRT